MKKNLYKRSLSWLLTLAMVFTMLPAAALAVEPETVPQPEQVTTIPQEDTDVPSQGTEAANEGEEVLGEDHVAPAEAEAPAAPSEAEPSIGGEIAQAQTWNSSTTMNAAVTIKGGSDIAPVVITVDGTVAVTQGITVAEGHVKFVVGDSGTGTLKRDGSLPSTTPILTISGTSQVTITGVTLDGGAVWGAADNSKEADKFLGRSTANNGTAGPGFTVAAGATLTLGEGAIVENFSLATTIFDVAGTLNVNGATIQNNQHAGDTRYMMFKISGTMNMTAGTVSGNFNSGVSNCGVFMAYESGAAITISGGTMEKNLSNAYAGVISSQRGTITVKGTAKITNNKAVKGGGAALIYLGSLTLQGNAVLEGNTSESGGAVFVNGSSAKFIMEGGTISGNTATTGNGGGVYFTGAGTNHVMENGTISKNTAPEGIGGGIYVEAGTLTMGKQSESSNPIISENSAKNGGGIGLAPKSTNDVPAMQMYYGTISGNIATEQGGGIYADNKSIVSLASGTIEGNQGATRSNVFGGGGITVMGGTVFIGDGTGTADMLIQGNEAYDGAGVMVGRGNGTGNGAGGGTVTINADAKISGNTGTFGAGVYAAHGTVTIDGATITDNTVSGGGGGLLVYDNDEQVVTLKGKVTITGNEKGTELGAPENTPDNVQINIEGAKLYLTEALHSAAQVGLHTSGNGHEAWPLVTAAKSGGSADDNAKIAADSRACFFDDGGTHAIIQDESNKANLVWGDPIQTDLYVDANEENGDINNNGTKQAPFQTLAKALQSASKQAPCTIHLLSNVKFTTRYNDPNSGAGKNITITSDNDEAYTIDVESKNTRAAFHLATNEDVPSHLTLTNVIVDGANHPNGIYGEFFIDKGGSLTLGDNATLQNFTPRAVNVRSGGTFTMLPGSKIQGCVAGFNQMYNRGSGGDGYNGTDGVGAAVYVCPSGTFDMRGGIITGNKAEGYTGTTDDEDPNNPTQNAKVHGYAGGVFGEMGAIFNMSGTPVVKDNTGGNVYLNTTDNGSQTITVTAPLTEGAEVYVYTSKVPKTGDDVQVATGASVKDLNYFHSDNADFAGLIWCGGPTTGSGDAEKPHTDTPITTDGHDKTANTIWLSVDARETADISVSVATDGTLILEAHELDPNKFYTVLDKDGNAVKTDGMTLVTGSSASNGWFKPTASGDLVWSGLDPEKGPYQVVSSENTAEAPNGTATATTDTKVGGQIIALYVAGAGGGSDDSAWAAGVDNNDTNIDGGTFNRGSRAYPYKTLTHAYGVLDTKSAQAGIITVLSSIEQGASLTFKPTTGAVILGEGEKITVKRAVGDNASVGLFDVNGCAVTFSNLIIDGDKNTIQEANSAFSVHSEGKLTLKDCTVENHNISGNANSNWDKGLINGGTNTQPKGYITLDGTTIQNNVMTRKGWSLVAGGHLLIKNSSIINNHSTATSVYAVSQFASATLLDKVLITGNTNKNGTANLGLLTGAVVAVATYDNSAMRAGSVVGVTAIDDNAPTEGKDTPVTNHRAQSKLTYFFSDHPELYGVKLGATDKFIYLGVDAKMTITAGEPDVEKGTTSIVISPADPDKDYWAVDAGGNKVGPGVYDTATGTVTISPLDPDKAYTVVVVPKDTASANVPTTGTGNGGVEIVSPPATAVVAPDEDGGYQSGTGEDNESKREANADATDKITIKGETDYSYAVRVKNEDGTYTYYQQAGGSNGTTPVWVDGNGSDIVFDNLPFAKDYEIVKVKTDNKDNANAIPAVTPIPTLPPVVGENDITTKLTDNGKVDLTISPTISDKHYVVVGPDGKVVAAVTSNGGTITFPNLDPGTKYQVVTQAGGELPEVGAALDKDQLKRATDVTTPLPTDVTFAVSETPGKVDATFKPATADMDYYVKTGTTVVGPGTVNPDGTVTFKGLDPDTDYTMVAVKKGVEAPADFSTVPNHDFKTPSSDAKNAADALKGKDIETTTNTITVKDVSAPTNADYVAIGPDGKEHVGKIVDGNLVFDGLNANTKYDIVVRDTVNGVDLDPDISATTKPSNSGNDSSSSGSGGGASTTSKVEKTENGTAKVDKPTAGKGQTVIITVTPDPGYELDTLVVKDKNGKELEVKDLGNGKYSYVVPEDRPATVTVTFKKTTATGDPETNGVADLLIVDDHIAYMQGDELGNFRPTGSITRAETAQMFYNLLKNKNVTGGADFADVGSGAWYAQAVLALANLNIVEGVGDGNFEPNRAITRAEFVAVAMRFATHVTGTKTFTDVNADYWAHGYITGAAYYGWINGYEDGTFLPTNPITRAEAATVVNNMLAREGDKSFIDATEDLRFFPDVEKGFWAFYEIVEATNAHDFTRDEGGVETWDK